MRGDDDARVLVWRAMADLFLDTDVRLHFADVALVAAGSPFRLDELEHICLQEVAPIVEPNLLAVAGEWAAFDDDWLVASIRERLAGKAPRHRLRTDAHARWQRVAHLVERLRGLPESERAARAQQWQQLRGHFQGGAVTAAGERPVGPEERARLLAEMRPAYGCD